jgi:hypothetical protein
MRGSALTWPLNASVSSATVKASETRFTEMWDGKVADEDSRVRMVMFREGSARRAARMGAPTEPVACFC